MSTIENAKKAGIRVCSGGILGLNETLEQRVEMAYELKRLGIDSVPLNILNPIKGTPFEHNKPLAPLEILRTFAMFRFVCHMLRFVRPAVVKLTSAIYRL